jgi:ABC-type thiamine transport system ATPase subunit
MKNIKIIFSADFLIISLVVLCECLSVLILPQLFSTYENFQPIFIAYFIVLMLSISSHFLTPIYVFKLACKYRDYKYKLIYKLKTQSFQVLDRLMQKDEQIFLNNIQSKIYIALRLIQIFFILVSTFFISNIDNLLIFVLAFILLFFYKRITANKSKKINADLAKNFLLITKIRRIGSLLSKSIFYNHSTNFSKKINNIYVEYYRNLALQGSISNGYRSLAEITILLFFAYYSFTLSKGFDIKTLTVLAYSGLKIIPYIQQLNFYLNIVNFSGQIESQLYSSETSPLATTKNNYIKEILTSAEKIVWIHGDSGSGKTTLLDKIALYLKLHSASLFYYVQNQRPMKSNYNKNVLASWIPRITKVNLSGILDDNSSQGEFQRLALSEFFSPNLEYILLDEPFSNQSENYIKSISRSLLEISKKSKKIFIVSHISLEPYFPKIKKIHVKSYR